MKHLLLLFSFVLIAACSQEQAGDDGRQFRIAYNVAVDIDADDYDIFSVNLDGTGTRNITNNPDVAWTYLAGTQKVFFISDRDTCRRCFFLYEMDADGGNVRRISDVRLRDSWMSARENGTELIVNPHGSVDSVFYIIDLEGNLLQKLPTGLAFASDPCFSPDGKRVVFRGGLKKSKREPGFGEELYIINDDGTGLRQLTHYPDSDTTAPWFAYKAGPPRWNAAGDYITYQSFQNHKYSLFGVSPDGERQWKLTGNEEQEGWHDWSPDGKWLAIELFDSLQTEFHIGLMDWETKEMSILTDTVHVYQQAPAFVTVH